MGVEDKIAQNPFKKCFLLRTTQEMEFLRVEVASLLVGVTFPK